MACCGILTILQQLYISSLIYTKAVFFLWGYLSLIVPSKVFLGPMTPAGDVPRYVGLKIVPWSKDLLTRYSANGVQFYVVSLISYLLLIYLMPGLPSQIYKNFPEIISSLNIFSLLFCVGLLIKGHFRPEVWIPKEKQWHWASIDIRLLKALWTNPCLTSSMPELSSILGCWVLDLPI